MITKVGLVRQMTGWMSENDYNDGTDGTSLGESWRFQKKNDETKHGEY